MKASLDDADVEIFEINLKVVHMLSARVKME
jgi:hypothetical protein